MCLHYAPFGCKHMVFLYKAVDNEAEFRPDLYLKARSKRKEENQVLT